MSKLLKFLPLLFLLTISFGISAYSRTNSTFFTNPIVKTEVRGCESGNLRDERFTSESGHSERVKLCQAVERITIKLNQIAWSPALASELKRIWDVFSAPKGVTLRLMPVGESRQLLAAAQPFPSGITSNDFEASVFLRPENAFGGEFFQVFFHELRHVYDFHFTWKNKSIIDGLQLERQAFLLMSKLSEEMPPQENFSNLPKLWEESWRHKPAEEIALRREKAIGKYLQNSKLYRLISAFPKKSILDFSRLKSAFSSNGRTGKLQLSKETLVKDTTRLPDRPRVPQTSAILPQNIQELNFNLEKPKNLRDEKEILHIALSNEKKIFYGMSNFVYDQKLHFQCWRKGKVTAEFNENNSITRTLDGKALYEKVFSQTKPLKPACAANYPALKTDFTETFWASPALERMPITFDGFVETEGKILARYTVLQPDQRLFKQLVDEYHFIKPFRVFVGTIFVLPEDGQIVKFWGTSFPENTITGYNSQEMAGTYSVTAVRQKMAISSGLWITVFIGTSGVGNNRQNLSPFSYTVKFENYRQAATDVRIFDEEEITEKTVQ